MGVFVWVQGKWPNCNSRPYSEIGAKKKRVQETTIGTKTAEDGDGNVGKTIRLITQDKKRT